MSPYQNQVQQQPAISGGVNIMNVDDSPIIRLRKMSDILSSLIIQDFYKYISKGGCRNRLGSLWSIMEELDRVFRDAMDGGTAKLESITISPQARKLEIEQQQQLLRLIHLLNPCKT